MTANVTAATVSMKCWAADDGVGWQIETRSVIVATGEGSLNASFRSVLERSAVSAMIHYVETKVHELQLIRERHSAVKQIKVTESESLDFVPTELIDMKFDKVSASSPNPLNQCMRVELEWCTMFYSFIIDPVDEFFFLDDFSQTIVVRIAGVRRCLRQAELQSFIHRDEEVLLFVLCLTSKLGDLESNLD